MNAEMLNIIDISYDMLNSCEINAEMLITIDILMILGLILDK